jgi:hypothetical protein
MGSKGLKARVNRAAGIYGSIKELPALNPGLLLPRHPSMAQGGRVDELAVF